MKVQRQYQLCNSGKFPEFLQYIQRKNSDNIILKRKDSFQNDMLVKRSQLVESNILLNFVKSLQFIHRKYQHMCLKSFQIRINSLTRLFSFRTFKKSDRKSHLIVCITKKKSLSYKFSNERGRSKTTWTRRGGQVGGQYKVHAWSCEQRVEYGIYMIGMFSFEIPICILGFSYE